MLGEMAVTRERVAEQLLALRRLHGTPDKPLSQEKAAQRAEVSTRDWQRWEAKATLPRTDSLSRVAEGFDIPLETFDNGDQPKSATPLGDRLDRIEQMLQQLLEAQGITPPPVTGPGEGPLISDAATEPTSPKAAKPKAGRNRSAQRPNA